MAGEAGSVREKHSISGDLLHEVFLSLLHSHRHVAPSHCASMSRIESSERQHTETVYYVHVSYDTLQIKISHHQNQNTVNPQRKLTLKKSNINIKLRFLSPGTQPTLGHELLVPQIRQCRYYAS